LELLYSRHENQQPISEYISDTVTPSRLEDWHLFESFEDEFFRGSVDEETYSAWKAAYQLQWEKKADWLRAKKMQAIVKTKK
jgi:hypothetical protein